MHCDALKQDNDSTVRGDGGSRVGEVRAGTTSPIPEHKGDPPIPAYGPGSLSVNIPDASQAPGSIIAHEQPMLVKGERQKLASFERITR